MCKIPNLNIGIKDLNFARQRGKMAVRLTDGRELIVPLHMYPDIKRLTLKQRNQWMILDEQFFTFTDLSRVYSLTELFKLL